MQAGAAVDQVNDLGAQTPLHLLASRVGKQSNTANRILCAKTLIKAGCDLGKKNEDGVMAYRTYLNGEEGDDVVELRTPLAHHALLKGPLCISPPFIKSHSKTAATS